MDTAAFAAYCDAYSRWRTAVESVARMAGRDELMHGLLIKTMDGNARINPLVRVVGKAAEDMVRFASEFGLTPAARSRIATGQPPGPLKFDGLLA